MVSFRHFFLKRSYPAPARLRRRLAAGKPAPAALALYHVFGPIWRKNQSSNPGGGELHAAKAGAKQLCAYRSHPPRPPPPPCPSCSSQRRPGALPKDSPDLALLMSLVTSVGGAAAYYLRTSMPGAVAGIGVSALFAWDADDGGCWWQSSQSCSLWCSMQRAAAAAVW